MKIILNKETYKMSEASDLKKIQEKARKQRAKIEIKYGKVAKQRLNKINKVIIPKQSIMDMNDKRFDEFLKILTREMTWIKNAQNQQKNNQQQRQ